MPRPLLAKFLRFDPLLRLHPLFPKTKLTVASKLPPWKFRTRDAFEEEAFRDRCRKLRERLILEGLVTR